MRFRTRFVLTLTSFLLLASRLQAEDRVLQFPTDRSMGILRYYDLENSSWKELGKAQGDVKTPMGKPLVLIVSAEAVKDLAPLEKLPKDAFDQLVFDGLQLGDDALGHLKNLGSLRKISFREAQLSDATIEALQCLKNLTELDFSLASIGDAGVRHLKPMKLETLDLSATQVSNASVDTLGEMKTLRYLDPQKTNIDEQGLEKLKEALPECIIVER